MNKNLYADLTGKKFNRLLVIKESHYIKKSKKRYWECLCDCGKLTTVQSQQLKNNKTKSCGCLKSELCIARCKTTMRNYKKDSWLRERFSGIKRHAKSRNRIFKITYEDTIKLIQSPCHYCGKLELEKSCIGRNLKKRLAMENMVPTNGLDRVDSSKDYTLDNVVPCCVSCNTRKTDSVLIEFMCDVKRIYEHMKLSNLTT